MRSFFAGVLCATALVTTAVAQTLTIGVRGGPDSIDPHFTATGTHAEALKHVFDTLVWSGDGLELEPRFSDAVADGLAARGHSIERVPNVGGGMGGIAFHTNGDMEGAACWRADGTPIGVGGGFARAGVRFLPEARRP